MFNLIFLCYNLLIENYKGFNYENRQRKTQI